MGTAVTIVIDTFLVLAPVVGIGAIALRARHLERRAAADPEGPTAD
ncbi:MAG: hypothetical protein ACRDZW_10740 [Acidimicrobiales bacterium]